jgi:hypothetical protein
MIIIGAVIAVIVIGAIITMMIVGTTIIIATMIIAAMIAAVIGFLNHRGGRRLFDCTGTGSQWGGARRAADRDPE